MLNINAFRLVVQEKKIFEDLSKFSLLCPLYIYPYNMYKPSVCKYLNLLSKDVLNCCVQISLVYFK